MGDDMIFVSTGRLLQIGVMYTIVTILFLYLGVKVLKRGKQITNKYMGVYYVWMGITMTLNVLYVILDIEEVIAVLANLVAASIMFSQVLLLLFILIIRHSQAEINKTKQLMWIAISALLAIGLVLVGTLGLGATWGIAPITLDKVPVNAWYYALYYFVVIICFIGLTMYNAYVARKGFADATMKKRFTYFLIGMALLFWIAGMNPWANLEPASAFRTFFGLSAIMIFPAAILLYLSLGKEVDKKE
jgi:hypothetical protein